jgi:hypothetical protein
MNQAPENAGLSQLRDIHLPAAISWWPPAIGWWLLLAFFLLAVIGLWFFYRRRRRNAWRRTALDELAKLRRQYQTQLFAPQPIVGELSVLMRRVAISRFPREEAARLSGDAWLAFLDRNGKGDAGFQTEPGRLLAVAPYAQEMNISAEQMNSLFALCEGWITQLSSTALRSGGAQ